MFTLNDIRQLSNLLNGNTPEGQPLNSSIALDLKTPRYLLILYAGSKFPLFVDYQNEELDGGCTSWSLAKVANILELKFDRTKTSMSIYNKAIKKRHVKKVTSKNKMGFKLTEKGEKWVDELFQCVNMTNDSMKKDRDSTNQLTSKREKEFEKELKELDKLNPEERIKKVLKDSEGQNLFEQPSQVDINLHKLHELIT